MERRYITYPCDHKKGFSKALNHYVSHATECLWWSSLSSWCVNTIDESIWMVKLKPKSYLQYWGRIQLSQQTPQKYRLKTRIFTSEMKKKQMGSRRTIKAGWLQLERLCLFDFAIFWKQEFSVRMSTFRNLWKPILLENGSQAFILEVS